MSVEENKAIVRRWIEDGWGKGDLSAIDECMAAEYVRHWNGLKPSDSQVTVEGLKKNIVDIRSAIPDYEEKIDEMIAEGDKVAVYSTSTGTHKGQLGNYPPTNKRGRFTLSRIARIANGKVVEVTYPSGIAIYWSAMMDGSLFKDQEES